MFLGFYSYGVHSSELLEFKLRITHDCFILNAHHMNKNPKTNIYLTTFILIIWWNFLFLWCPFFRLHCFTKFTKFDFTNLQKLFLQNLQKLFLQIYKNCFGQQNCKVLYLQKNCKLCSQCEFWIPIILKNAYHKNKKFHHIINIKVVG